MDPNAPYVAPYIAKDKIHAIKLIRSIPVRLEDKPNAFGLNTIVTADMGLKAAKDLVESIIALGISQDYESLKSQHEQLKRSFRELDDKYFTLLSSLRNILADTDKIGF